MQDINQPIKDLQTRFKQAFKTLSPVIGNEVVNFAKDNFKRQGFMDTSFNPWKPRVSKKDKGRAILIKSRRLERSIHVIRSNESETVVGSSSAVPYARIHNEGGEINHASRSETFSRNRITRGKNKGLFKKGVVKGVQGFTFKERKTKMPQRQYLGKSANLTERLKRIADVHFKKFL